MQNSSEKIANKMDWVDWAQLIGILIAIFIYVNGIIHSYKYHNKQDSGALDRYSTLPLLRGVEYFFHKNP